MIISILIAKAAALILHLFGRGATTLPGRLALKINRNLLSSLSRGVKIICVTGTNGKTTTCALIEHAFRENGISCFINNSGANMISGIATAFIMNSSIFGKCRKEYAILECDENSLPLITRSINADILIVTNVFRDQLDRYGEVNTTLLKIAEGIKNMPRCKLILNADCPLTYSLSLNCKNEVITFGINSDIYNASAVSDSRYCPVCKSPLQYKSRLYAQLGSFYCSRCSYSRREPDYSVNDIVEAKENGAGFILNCKGKKALASTSLGGIYNHYNFCAAAAALKEMKIENISPLCSFSGAFGRMERFKNGDKTVLLLLVKNPVGLSGCIRYISRIKGEVDAAFALNDNDADGRDISWIWDSDFTPLKTKSAGVYTLGTRSLDMALRLKYDGIAASVIEGENYSKLIEIIENSGRDFVIFSTYTAMMNMRPYFISRFGGKEFWKQ